MYFVGKTENVHFQQDITHEFTTSLQTAIKENNCTETQAMNLPFFQNLPFVTAVVKESLRYFPVVGIFGRAAKKDAVLEWKARDTGKVIKEFIKKESVILFVPLVWHFSPIYYNDPERFNPNRWIEGHKEYDGKMRTNHFSWSPFGQGGR